jgi:nucleosome binding factor SPN SPT16 subunit
MILWCRSSDLKHANKVVQEIKLLRSTVAQRDKERAERATLVAQEKLIQGGLLVHKYVLLALIPSAQTSQEVCCRP